jgi:UDP-2-acetamido-2-deoxy-ribo-hexuluronate aminotransferase
MREIQMVDLKTQYENIQSEINDAIQKVFLSSNFINGPEIKVFEENLASFLKIKNVISCANGTDALQIAMMALKLQPGDEVIFPCFTYIAPVEAAILLQLKPILVDVNPHTFNIDPEKTEAAITSRTKAIVIVHLFGQSSEMRKIMEISQKYKLTVIEDNAQALGAEYFFSKGKKSMTGTIGTIGTTSFFPSKNLGCYGDGGALMTNDPELAKTIRMIANHGQKEKYKHEVVGINSRLDTIQAAILDIKLKKLKNYIYERSKLASYYDEAFSNHPDIIIPYRDKNSTHIFHQYTIKIDEKKRDELRSYLQDRKIPTMVYYPIPVHVQEVLKKYRYKKGDFPISEELCKTVLSLPMHTELDKEQLNYIIDNVINFFKK